MNTSAGHDDKEGETETFTSRYGAETVPGDGKSVDRTQGIIESSVEPSRLEGSSPQKTVSSSLELEASRTVIEDDAREKRATLRMKMRPAAAFARGTAPGLRNKKGASALPSEESRIDECDIPKVIEDDARKKRAVTRIQMRPAAASTGGYRTQIHLDKISEEKVPEDGEEFIEQNFPLHEYHEVEEERVDIGDAGLTMAAGLTLPPAIGTTIALGGAPSILPGAFAIAGPGENGTNEETELVDGGREVPLEDGSASDEDDGSPIHDAPLNAFAVPNRDQPLINAAVYSVPPLVPAKKHNAKQRKERWGFLRKRRVQVFLIFAVVVAVCVVVGVIIMARGSSSSPTLTPTTFPSASPTISSTPTSAPTVTSWLQVGSDINAVAGGDRFGDSVSLSKSGTRLAIGAPYHDSDGVENRGLVQVFQKDNEGNWVQLGKDLIGDMIYDYFGESVSISGDGERLAVGAPLNNGSRGQVKVFQLAKPGWELIGSQLFGEAQGDQFGTSVSLSMHGNIVAVGANYHDGIYGEKSGRVRVFELKSNSWTQLGNDIDGEGADDRSGVAISLSVDGLTVAIGAGLNDGVSGENSGHVRIYTYENGNWTQVGQDIDGEAEDDRSGRTVSLSSNGTIVAVGARYNDGANGRNSGHVRVYEYEEGAGEWSQLGGDIDGEARKDYSGRSVSLSSDGTIVAVGTDFNNGNGFWSGHVRIYRFDGNNWVQVGADIDGEASRDHSGSSVSVSGDGSIVAIGAPRHNANEENIGHVRVFNWPKDFRR